MPKKKLIFVVDAERDQDIVSWWAKQENKSAALRALIRKEIHQQGITLQDIYQAVVEIERKLALRSTALVVDDGDDGALDEPQDVAETLDKLGL